MRAGALFFFQSAAVFDGDTYNLTRQWFPGGANLMGFHAPLAG
jgi:hypothetical protein